MTTLGGKMAGLSFAVRAPDEARARKVIELFSDFAPVEDADFICDIEGSDAEVSDELKYGEHLPEINFERENGIVRVLVGKEKAIIGVIDRENLRGTYHDIVPERFDLLFSNFFRCFVQTCLLKFKALIFHGCGVAHDGKGYLFTGQSGTGKTTIANRCDEREVISDEYICVAGEGGKWRIHSTFWRCWNSGSADLAGIFILHRDEAEPPARRLGRAETVSWMSQNLLGALRTLGDPLALVDILAAIASDVERHRMRINPGEFSIDGVVKVSSCDIINL